MNTLKRLLLITSLTLLPAFSTAFSQVIIPTPRPTHPSETLPSRPINGNPIPDIDFIQRASEGLIFEVLAGNLALSHSFNPAVRKFAARMVRSHSRDYSQLSAVAIRVGLQVAVQPDEDQRDDLKKLSKLFGPAFDQAYLQIAIEGHIEDIQDYLKEVRNGILAPVRNFANQNLPELNLHLQLAFITVRKSGVTLSAE